MKKLWLVLLSLGLIMAFSVSAFAVDVKVSAEYYAAGMYLNKVYLGKSDTEGDWENPSTAFYFQRLRMGADFIVSPCLKLVTRFDAMERIWGGERSSGYGGGQDGDYYSYSAGTRAENENIAFDIVYIDYTAPVGQFKVGYQKDRVWGTVFADYGERTPAGQIQYWKSFGPATLFVGYAKEVDNSWSVVSSNSPSWDNQKNASRTDRDADSYRLGAIYNFNTSQAKGETGVLFTYDRDATCRGRACGSYMSNIYVIDPYVKAKIGPVDLQAEFQYWFGDAKKYEGYVVDPNYTNSSINAFSVFVDANAKFGIVNVGGSFAWLSGDDPNTNEVEGSASWVYFLNTAGFDWNPCLIMFNNDVITYWMGYLEGFGPANLAGPMNNAWFAQGRVGVQPTPQINVMMSLSWAKADKALMTGNGPTPGTTYGWEVDLVGTYKITNNLTYMLGAGYLFTGDIFKGCDQPKLGHEVTDDYMFINKLTLTF